MQDTIKIREGRARRALAKRGYAVRKTPARSGLRTTYDVGYMIIEIRRNLTVLGASSRAYEASLEDVEEFVSRLSPE